MLASKYKLEQLIDEAIKSIAFLGDSGQNPQRDCAVHRQQGFVMLLEKINSPDRSENPFYAGAF